MLNPNQNRLDYGNILAPPLWFILDFAVGTTYSLDLDALVGACILNLQKLLESLFDGPEDGANNPFVTASIDNMAIQEENEGNSALDVIIKTINRLKPMAEAEFVEDFYRLTVHFPAYQMENQYKVTLRPLLCNKVQKLAESVVFDKMTLTELSAFYVLSVSEDGKTPTQRVIKISTGGLPEEREQKIISTIIGDNPQNFYRYIAFLLGENAVIGALEAEDSEQFIRLIPLTPDTSFRMTRGAGIQEERAIMYQILIRIPELKRYRSVLETLMMADAESGWHFQAKEYGEKIVAECDKLTQGAYLTYMTDRVSKELARADQDGNVLLEQVIEKCKELRRRKRKDVKIYGIIGKL